MKVTEPTPSQAAVVLKNYFHSKGIDIKLGMAQEAIALTKGYASWNALSSQVPARGETRKTALKPLCKKCGSNLVNSYCEDTTCPFNDWPQQVELDDLYELPGDVIERKYGVKERTHSPDNED